MTLKRYAQRVTETYGLVHQSNLRALRYYIKEHTEVELVEEIAGLKDAVLLRALWEAGLSSVLQDAVLDRLNKLI